MRVSINADTLPIKFAPVLRNIKDIDPKQRKALQLFQEFDVVTSRQIGELFGFQPRTSSALCASWVKSGFLEIVDPSNESRKYRRARSYRALSHDV